MTATMAQQLGPRHSDDYDYLLKIVIIGDSGVGKTNLLSRFVKNEFNIHSKATIGVEFSTANVVVGEDVVKAQIWDTAGQERYRAISSAFYRGAVGALLVYDVTSGDSFQHIDRWLAELRDHAAADILIMLVGNKVDLVAEREVPIAEAQALAETQGLLFIETSALSGSHVADAFLQVVHSIHGRLTAHRISSEEQGPQLALPEGSCIDISQPPPAESERPSRRSGCCGG